MTSRYSKRRGRWQFSLRALALMIALIGLLLTFCRDTSEPPEPLTIQVSSQGVRLNSRTVTWAALPQALRNRAQRMQAAAKKNPRLYYPPPFRTVVIEVTDDATFGDFKRAIEIATKEAEAWDGGAECRFCIQVVGQPAARADGDVICHVFPDYLRPKDQWGAECVLVQVTADDCGDVGEITSEGPTTRISPIPALPARDPRYTKMHSEAAAASGFYDSPDTWCCVGDPPSASLWCDDHLKFRHVRSVMEALAVHIKPNGDTAGLLPHIHLLPFVEAKAERAAAEQAMDEFLLRLRTQQK